MVEGPLLHWTPVGSITDRGGDSRRSMNTARRTADHRSAQRRGTANGSFLFPGAATYGIDSASTTFMTDTGTNRDSMDQLDLAREAHASLVSAHEALDRTATA